MTEQINLLPEVPPMGRRLIAIGDEATQRRICADWQAGKLSEGQAARLLGVDRLEARKISFDLGIPWCDEMEAQPCQEE